MLTRPDENVIAIDGNNPLIGKNITFSGQVHAFRDASKSKIKYGMPGQGPILS